jgi:hypothetical protein
MTSISTFDENGIFDLNIIPVFLISGEIILEWGYMAKFIDNSRESGIYES